MFKQNPHKMRVSPHLGYTSLFVKSTETPDGGIITKLERAKVDDVTVPDLPSPDTFSVEAYQRAGIPLNRVNTSVLGSATIDTDVSSQVENLLNQVESETNKD